MSQDYFYYEMSTLPLVTSQSSGEEDQLMSEFSTSLDPSEADVEAAVTFKGAEGRAARYRGQSDTSSPQHSENEDFLDIQVTERVGCVLCCRAEPPGPNKGGLV